MKNKLKNFNHYVIMLIHYYVVVLPFFKKVTI